jgi:hypothetical protein
MKCASIVEFLFLTVFVTHFHLDWYPLSWKFVPVKCVQMVEFLLLTMFVTHFSPRLCTHSMRVGTFKFLFLTRFVTHFRLDLIPLPWIWVLMKCGVPIVEYLFLTEFVTHFCLDKYPLPSKWVLMKSVFLLLNIYS